MHASPDQTYNGGNMYLTPLEHQDYEVSQTLSRPYLHQNSNKELKIYTPLIHLQSLRDYERFCAKEWVK